MRQRLEEIFLRLVRLYTFNTPIKKGKYRAYQWAMTLCRGSHTSLMTRSREGFPFCANLKTGMENTLFFLGEYEPFLSRIVKKLVNTGDICLDVGANFGWYTFLMASKCGTGGAVYAFEPMPSAYASLAKNYELANRPDNIFINNCGLGDSTGTFEINMFEGFSSGHASLSSDAAPVSAAFDCELITLDDYLTDKSISRIDFVKVDIEGAELMFLKGAERLFAGGNQPVILIEMALATTKNFGYLPDDLIKFIGSHADYEFYAADERAETIAPIDRFAQDDIGANVFCVPRRDLAKIELLQEYFGK